MALKQTRSALDLRSSVGVLDVCRVRDISVVCASQQWAEFSSLADWCSLLMCGWAVMARSAPIKVGPLNHF